MEDCSLWENRGNYHFARRSRMPATTRKTVRSGRGHAVDDPRQFHKQAGQRQRVKQQSLDEEKGGCERRLRERVTYMLWIMAQALD